MIALYLTDYFYPFVHGGAETSIFEMAKALTKRKCAVYILTPNYGDLQDEVVENVAVHRYPFPVKISSLTSALTTAWHFNPIYWIGLTAEIIRIVKKHHFDVIHCQSATTVISGVVAGRLLRIPTVITFRDNQILCNYGLCLTTNQFGKTCNLYDYFTRDFLHYYQDKVTDKNMLKLMMQLFSACLGRVRVKALQFFAQRCDARIVSSSAQQRTFKVNGFTDTQVINNIYPFSPLPSSKKTAGMSVLYATKLSAGKGLDLLLESFRDVIREFPSLNLQVVGGGDIGKYSSIAKKLGVEKNVRFSGILAGSEVMELRRNSLLEVVPSIYPESFGRTALEALASGLPVVASNRGGLTDIVEDGKTGYVVSPTIRNISEAIIKAVKKNSVLRQNINRDYPNLKRKFETLPINQHVALYKSLI